MEHFTPGLEQQAHRRLPQLERLASQYGFVPSPEARPSRCRAIIFNPEGTKILVIERHKTDRIYNVFIGGGMEDVDASAEDCVRRELREEVGLKGDDVAFDDRVLEHEGEFFFLGVAREEFAGLRIGGPEADRDMSVSGTYTPAWHDTTTLVTKNTFPIEISEKVQHASSSS